MPGPYPLHDVYNLQFYRGPMLSQLIPGVSLKYLDRYSVFDNFTSM